MVTEEDVRKICLALPAVEEKLYDKLPSWRVKDKLFARIRERPDALVVYRPHIEEKCALIAAEPAKYFETPHYENYPVVLVNLEAINENELEDVLVLAWTLRAPAKLANAYKADA